MHIVCGISTDFLKTSNGQALQNITTKQGYDILSAFVRKSNFYLFYRAAVRFFMVREEGVSKCWPPWLADDEKLIKSIG